MRRDAPDAPGDTTVMLPRRRLAARLAVAAILVLGALSWAAPAGAHPFLVRTDPGDGARLARAPQLVSLQFSEPLSDAPAELSIAREGDRSPRPLVATIGSGRRVVEADVALGRGLYRVTWRVVADDGHLSEGSFAFAIGPVPGLLPRATTADAPASPLRSAAGWVFFAGLALALGAAATSVAVDRDRSTRHTALGVGLLVALVGTVAMWLASTGGVGGPVGTVRQRGLLAAASALLAVAVQLRRRPLLAGVLAASAAVVWSARSQVGVANGALGIVLDSVHLAAGAVWAGALGLLVADLWVGRHDRDAQPLLARARRYAGLAAVPVGVLAAAGVLSAVLMVPTVADLWETGYGRLLIVKTVLFAAALGLAWRARRRLRDGGLDAARRLTRPEAALVVGVLVLAAVLANTAPPPPPVAASLLGPPPLAGPVVRDAGLAGILTVAVAVGDGRLQVEVLVPDDESDKGAADVTVDGAGPAPGGFVSCGDGCLTASWQPRVGESTIRVTASAQGWRGGTFTTVVQWPPAPEDPELLERVVDAMRAEAAVEMVERTSSGPDSVVVPMRYNGTGAELVGEAPYASGGAEDVRPFDGDRGLRLYLPGDRLWVTMWLDEAGRIVRERIINVGLQIDHEFRYGSAAIG